MNEPLLHVPPDTAVARSEGRWWIFETPRDRVRAVRIEDVLPAVREAGTWAEAGDWAVGGLAYESAPAFDPALTAHSAAPGAPLAVFVRYARRREIVLPRPEGAACIPAWNPGIRPEEYRSALREIRRRIALGETYQVNFTFPLRAAGVGDPWALFLRLAAAQNPPYGFFAEWEGQAICSASPELFFERRGALLVSKPMKGTRPRGRGAEEDRALADALGRSAKERAENVMITDMVRNDLGRICAPGTVATSALCARERHPSVWQTTSTVEGETSAGFLEILRALFPAASITGAPKRRTMEIIRKLETGPRGWYTGALGFWGPDGRAQFNVAIRTLVADRRTGAAEYGVGGGITWDSDPDAEYAEAFAKAPVFDVRPEFDLLETMRWTPGDGWWLIDEHLARMAASAAYFGRPFDPAAARRLLADLEPDFENRARRVRLRADRAGELRAEHAPLAPVTDGTPLRLALASEAADSSDVFLYHKTTHRAVYDRHLRAHPEADDVVLWNERGELTETCRCNLALDLDGGWQTPPVSSGLLAGTARGEWLRQGRLRERVLRIDDLRRSARILLLNSVRGEQPAVQV